MIPLLDFQRKSKVYNKNEIKKKNWLKPFLLNIFQLNYGIISMMHNFNYVIESVIYIEAKGKLNFVSLFAPQRNE